MDLDFAGLCSFGEPTKERVEIGGDKAVWLRSPSSTIKDRWESWVAKLPECVKTENWRAKVVVLCLSDQSGNYLVEPTPESWNAAVEKIGSDSGLPPSAMEKLYDRAVILAGRGDAAVEAAEKN